MATDKEIEAAADALNRARYHDGSFKQDERPLADEDDQAKAYAYRLTRAALTAAEQVSASEWQPPFSLGDRVRHVEFSDGPKDGIIETVKDGAIVVNYGRGIFGEYDKGWFDKYAGVLVRVDD